MKSNVSSEQLAYKLLESVYINSRGRRDSYDAILNYDLFPSNWFDNESYEDKIEILKEAIDKGVLIKDTNSYQKLFRDIYF